jgi:hypothetical protein
MGNKDKAATVFRGGNFLSGSTIFKFQALGIDQSRIIRTDFTLSGLPLALPGFSDDGLRLAFKDGGSYLVFVDRWIEVFQGTD